ncbi:MAG: monooxygenase FAD-binding protein [Rhizobacter sp.]|nr:monooxygenase FAD-binding protein [Rhizobacter sp.]
MNPIVDTPVLIVGAGPVGLALAADLTSRGVKSTVVEPRTEPTIHPRATLLGSRSMEYYRRLGLDDTIVRTGLPTEHGYEVVFATHLDGRVLYRHGSASPDQYMAAHREMRTDLPESAWTPYFKVQIGQQALEPVVKGWLEERGVADLRYGSELVSFEQTDAGVYSVVRDLATGETRTVTSRFLVGCDGGRSVVRTQLGIPYVGRGAMRRNVSFLFRSADFPKHATVGRANLYFMFTPGAFGVFTNINGRDLWNYQHYVLDESEDDRSIDPETEIRRAMGHDFPFEIQQVMHWSHHQSVADRFQHGNVFLAGDSAHLFCPTGGIGMNTGIADAFNLGWKLGAVLDGWGGQGLLDSYEWERRPIAFRNTLAAASNADRIDSMMKTTPADIDEDSPQGDATRATFERRLRWLSKQFNTAGLHLGYRYAESPVVVADGTPEPADDPRIVVQSSWPGCRAPHIWLEPGRSTLDLFDGTGFVLMQFGTDDGAHAFEAAARDAHIPLRCERIDHPQAAALYEKALVLVRPDGHVVWRGNTPPANPGEVLAIASGNKTQ